MVEWEDALSVLVHERGAALVRYAARLTGDSRTAEDLTQQVLVRSVARGPLRSRRRVEAELRHAIRDAWAQDLRRRCVAGERIASV